MEEYKRTQLASDGLSGTSRAPATRARGVPQPPVAPDRYLWLLRKSKLLPIEKLDELLLAFAARTDLAMAVPEFIAASGVITSWQHASLLAGRHHFFLGGTKLLDLLGGGAMSNVYLGEHLATRSRVAIKILKAEVRHKGSLVERFCLEGRTMQTFLHPNILRVWELGHTQGQWYLRMELIDGCDLSTMVARHGTPSFAKAADYIRQAAEGLAYIHKRGIVHRDIKPDNLLVDESGVIKIFDLGLARVPTEDAQSLTALHRETILGTPDYMAPEQVLECHEVDGRADLYALGGTFYFLLTGHAPFDEGTLARRLLKHQHESPKSIYFARPETPTALVEICRRLLAKRPQDRFASADELSQALSHWLEMSRRTGEEAGGRPRRADAQDDFASLIRWGELGP